MLAHRVPSPRCLVLRDTAQTLGDDTRLDLPHMTFPQPPFLRAHGGGHMYVEERPTLDAHHSGPTM